MSYAYPAVPNILPKEGIVVPFKVRLEPIVTFHCDRCVSTALLLSKQGPVVRVEAEKSAYREVFLKLQTFMCENPGLWIFPLVSGKWRVDFDGLYKMFRAQLQVCKIVPVSELSLYTTLDYEKCVNNKAIECDCDV